VAGLRKVGGVRTQAPLGASFGEHPFYVVG
jgi:hypothetical protein